MNVKESKSKSNNSKLNEPLQNDAFSLIIPSISIVNDARFRAGRKLVQSGRVGENAIQMFAILVEEAQEKYGTDAIETAACYYEYGNALFRTAARMKASKVEKEEMESSNESNLLKRDRETSISKTKTEAIIRKRSAAAEAATKRLKLMKQTKIADDISAPTKMPSSNIAKSDVNQNQNKIDKDVSSKALLNSKAEPKYPPMSEDIELALEMMENSFSIMFHFTTLNAKEEKNKTISTHLSWCQFEIPRVLCGIGDLYSFLERHADAADAYIRALPYRESVLEQYQSSSKSQKSNDISKMPLSVQLDYLKARRLYTEVHVLIAEELLAHPSNLDVIAYPPPSALSGTPDNSDKRIVETSPTTMLDSLDVKKSTVAHTQKSQEQQQTKSSKPIVVVKKSERIEFAKGYYEKGRDELQETVYLMGKIASQKIKIGIDNARLDREKEDVCFLATILMGVGNKIADLELE